MTTIRNKFQNVRERIAAACAAVGRNPAEITLLAVSKGVAADAVRQAYLSAEQTAFGENYIQEAVEKMAQLHPLPLQWHCIGPIQSNKTQLVATHFSWAHSVDRLKIAQRLSQQRPAGQPPLNVCIQVNIDAAATKAGVAPQQTFALAQQILELPGLRLRGLMTLPQPLPDSMAQRTVHAQARALFERLRDAGLPLDTLSMGMSADLEAAIAAGSTLVRVGAALFGARPAVHASAPV